MEAFTYLFVFTIIWSFLNPSNTLDTVTPIQSIRDGDTLVSANRRFQLGFFSPGNSKGRYVGIWYTKSSGIVVWVANRSTPLNDHSGVLKVTNGVVILLNSTNSVAWSSNTSRTSENPVLELLDNGNLVVKDEKVDGPVNYLWQSFDYPCDTFLPEMKLGKNLVTGLDRFFTSWKSTDDPAQGEFSIRLDLRGLPQVVVMQGDTVKARGGSWNGLRLNGNSGLTQNPVFELEFHFNESEVYYEYKIRNSSVFTRYILNPSGIVQRFTWLDRTNRWELFSTTPADQCSNYAFCGAYASCNIGNTPVCACLEGFLPKSPKAWDSVDWSDGCVRRTPLNCSDGPDRDGFLKYTGLKLPETSSSWFDKTMSLKECEELCLKNCSCTAYGNLDIRKGGSGCLLWFGNLLDIREIAKGAEDQFYVRLAASELDHVEKKRRFSKKKQAGIIIGSAVLGMIIIGLVTYIWKKKLRNQAMTKGNIGKECDNVGRKEDIELPIFDLTAIANATDNFSNNKKLGEGGFGSVYKGSLQEGKEIAVKRLSKNSGQGMFEFKNEVILIAKLQHRNLVKLLGYCIEENEKMLIYEYMPNKSLDSLIFDQTKSKLLDWHKRINIIAGVARGLLYLHQDSRLRIIHRDLKASNILLDNDMNPKISDFGLAKSFGGDQGDAKTNRIIGTYGYMSPEYAVHGQYSIKSDVFSFGVLILEIVSGKKNRGFSHPEHHHNLLGHAWRLWIEGRPIELIDGSVGDFTLSEMLRCIHVGLLCVQQRSEDRPNMSSVVLMLSSESLLPKPRQPGFYIDSPEANSSCSTPCSTNGITFTLFEAR
ncbi:G-type lectin S-receptor-like serine/threonine-protein kinase At4g27290 isoform X1 [Quercus suber]|uniref:G-type lectin S-receptor-like serine/threonine-protein kinase At4g27290 isoform X1 n=1 Tax=Quercus suber TaxID=58331 RepID=UPI000CE1851D|nr:G-type lectin S-receptor-like serine/threonine-protein kinase At4g27290 isoform X1 [Quercus suber]